MAEFAALPLFTDAWIADTAHLTRAERGLYHDMLVLCWRSPECRMPNEIDWIAAKLRCSPDEVATIEKLIAEFLSSTGNWLTQKRLKKEFQYLRDRRKKLSELAKRRWNKEKTTSPRNAQNTGCSIAPTPTPTPSKNKKEPKGSFSRHDKWEPSVPTWLAVKDLGFSDDDQNFMLAEMRDWATANGKLKKDWDATYRNWARKALRDGKVAKSRKSTFADSFAQVDAVIDELRRREDGSGPENSGADIVQLSRLRQGPG